MNFYLISVFGGFVLISGIIALINFSKIGSRYYPFIFCLWLGAINEILSFTLSMNGFQTLLNSNIYVLLEAILLCLYFFGASVINSPRALTTLLSSLILVWCIENFLAGSITSNSTYFRIYASLLIVVLSINLVNRILFSWKHKLLKNPDFILCICFITYFTYKAMCQAFVIYGLTRDTRFLLKIYLIMVYINLAVNVLYIPAVIWISRKKRFILPLL